MICKDVKRIDDRIKEASEKMKPLNTKQLHSLANSLQRIDKGFIEQKIIEQAECIAEILVKGKDCELRKSANGVSIAEISKKIVAR